MVMILRSDLRSAITYEVVVDVNVLRHGWSARERAARALHVQKVAIPNLSMRKPCTPSTRHRRLPFHLSILSEYTLEYHLRASSNQESRSFRASTAYRNGAWSSFASCSSSQYTCSQRNPPGRRRRRHDRCPRVARRDTRPR